MSARECFAPEELDEILAAPEDDPRRRHAGTCAACGALLEEYRLYLGAAPPTGEALWPDAEEALRRRVAEAIGAPPAAPAAPMRAEPPPGAPSWLARLLHPGMRPAWALAAVIVVAAIALLWIDPIPRGGEPVLRGTADRGAVVIEEARLDATGLHLVWRAAPGADAYRVRFYSAAELREIGAREAGADTALELPHVALPGGLAAGDTLLVRIEALADEDVIGVSAPYAVQARR